MKYIKDTLIIIGVCILVIVEIIIAPFFIIYMLCFYRESKGPKKKKIVRSFGFVDENGIHFEGTKFFDTEEEADAFIDSFHRAHGIGIYNKNYRKEDYMYPNYPKYTEYKYTEEDVIKAWKDKGASDEEIEKIKEMMRKRREIEEAKKKEESLEE